MKKLLFVFLLNSIVISAQKLKIDTLLTDNISIRAIYLWDNKVWYTGTGSKFGFVHIKNPSYRKQILINNLNQDFRALTMVSKNTLSTVNVGSPAQFYGININFQIFPIDKIDEKNVFFDSYHFDIEHKRGIAISDPREDGAPIFSVMIPDKRDYKNKNIVKYYPGEAHFAASNTNIKMLKNKVWIATGGAKARIFKYDWKNPFNWEAYETPFVQGTSTQGIYSIDFYDENFGIAVGGDYTQQSENINNIAVTKDGGKTWEIKASGQNAGYMTCVKFRPKTQGKEIVAIGDQHISVSSDYGETWTKISDEKNLYVCEWINHKTLILAGKNRILKLTFLD